MQNKFFEGLSYKIDRIIDYLGSRTDLEIGNIFTQQLPNDSISNKEIYGADIKKDFDLIKSKDMILNQMINDLSYEQREWFYNISSNEQTRMGNHLRTISASIKDLSNLYISAGGVSDLYNINILFKNSYDSFIHFAQISNVSLDFLNQKISNDLNPKFKEKIDQVDTLIKDLAFYKGEASARKTKEIYKQKYENYKDIVHVYEAIIILLIVLSLALVFAQLYAHELFESLSIANIITIKITIIIIVATLFAYCFKQISFYRKISEQANQTYMELEALPDFLTHLPEVKQHEIRADLAKRYFGQNLFDSIKEDSLSIQEQAKANAEVLKSTSILLDVIKKQSN